MNCTYRSVWNDTTGTFVAASENAKSTGKKTSSGSHATGHGARFCLQALAISVALSFGANVYALPTGGVVAAGAASISAGALGTTINQSTQNAAINWQSFNIASSESVRFNQPNSSSVILNRVLGADPSSIFGSLTANGKVFLVNPNGILFGQGASVNVGGLVASTLNITDGDFMSGNYKFSGASSAAVRNQGAINADGGYVALLGANVSNDGVISAQLGTVALAAGNAITLDLAGDGLLNVTVNQGAVNALVQNGGLIQADGGQVLLTAQAAGSLLQSAVNNTGVIQAQTIQNHNGTIRLMGDMQSGTVSVSGTLDASGKGAGQTGGDVTVTGHHVSLFGAHIDASGDAGGGTVLVGGDLHGVNAAVQNAAATYMSADSSINADAVTNGSGGTVVLWANDSTRAYGSIAARGGAQGGDGGLIETSGHWLDVAGINVNASAPNGNSGTWLLDPADVTITDAASNPSFSGGNPNVFSPGSGAASANVNVTDIITALATTGVTINTANTGASGIGAGNITVAATVTPLDWTATTTLTLNAINNVTVNGPISGTNGSFIANAVGGNVNVNAATKTTTGSLTFTAKNDVNLAAATTVITGNITSTAGNDVNMTAASKVTTGNITSVAAHDVKVSAVSTITTGDMIFRADNDGTGPGVAAGTVAITCGSNCLTITTGNLSIRFNPVSYATTGAEITAYGGNLTGAGVLDAKAWVFGKGDNKMYDGTRAAIVSGLKPDILSVAPPVALGAVTNANFDTKNVGTSKLITYNSTFVTNPSYDLFAPYGTAAGTYTTRADITVRPLTVTAASDTRVYNGTPSSVGVPTVTGLQIGDAPVDTLTGPLTQAYASKNVMGTGGSTLVATGPYTVNDGNGGNNYTVTVNTAPGTITPLTLVGSITAANKMYDGNNTATITSRTLATPISGDTVSYTGGTALFSDKNVADGKTVTGTGLSLAGADAGNYTVNTTATTAANITPAPLTIQADNNTKVYGTTFTPANTAFTVPVPPIAGETVASVTEVSPAGTPATAAVPGPYAITPSNAAANGAFLPTNYTITYVDGALTVTPAPLTVTASDVTKSFGQAPALTAFTTAGLVNSDTVTSVTETSPGQPATASVAGSPYAIVPSAAIGSFTPTNYTISYVNGVLTVAAIPLTVTASNVAKSYGQTPALTAFTTAGLINGDTVGSVTETSPGQAATASVVGSPYAIIPSAATGGTFVPANYTIGYVNGVLTVAAIPLTVTANDASKAYGTTVTLPLTAFTTVGLINGDTVTSVTEASLGTPAGAPVAGSPYAITPSSAAGGTFTPSNYTINYVNGKLTVTAVPLSVTANDAAKIYGDTVTLPLTAFTTVGLVNGDTVSRVTETSPGTVTTAPVAGSPYVITPSGAAGGTFVPSNYTVSYVNGKLTVTPKALTGTITAADKIYDTTTAATITGRGLIGVVGADVVSYTGGTANFDTPNVGVGKTVTGTGLGLTGTDVANYTVNSTATTTASILPIVPSVRPPGVAPRVTPVTWIPVIAPVTTPPQLLALMSPVPPVVAVTQAPVVVQEEAPVVVPVETPPEIYVVPQRPRKQDRN